MRKRGPLALLYGSLACWLLLASAVSALGAPAATQPAPSRVLAVLNTDAGNSGRLVDQIIALLSDEHSVRLVERDALARILKEQTLTALSTDTAARVQLGRLVGADVMAILAQDTTAAGPGVRLLICDTATGARLGQLHLPAAKTEAQALAAEIRATLARFPQGVTSAIAVSDFVSRDLDFAYAHLQTDLADLLRDTLARRQGLAVLEVAEAKTLTAEKELIGGGVRRIVPVFVEGEFRTDRLAPGGPKVTLNVTIRRSGQVALKLGSRPIALDEAGKFILGDVCQHVLDGNSQSPTTQPDVEKDFALLVARADQFAQIGEFERAAALREAALLLKPEADDQRVSLVQNYCTWNRRPFQVWPRGATDGPGDPFWEQTVAHSRELWRRSLRHVEYLVRKGRVDLETGNQLFRDTVESITGIRSTMAQLLVDEESLKKDFVRQTGPALFQLERRRGNRTSMNPRVDVASTVLKVARFRTDGNFHREDDLQLLGDLLCDLFPEDLPPLREMLWLLEAGIKSDTADEAARRPTPAQWNAFLDRLVASKRPVVAMYGHFGRLCDHQSRLRDKSPALVAEAEALVQALKELPDRNDPDREAARAFEQTAVRLRHDLDPAAPPLVNPQPPRAAILPDKPQPQPQPRPQPQLGGSPPHERFLLKPLDIRVDPPDDYHRNTLREARWRGVGGESGWLELVPAWKGVDALYTYGAVLLVQADRIARVVLVDPKLHIDSVVFDGRYLWVAAGYENSIFVLDDTGKTVAHAGPDEGLPAGASSVPLLAISPGKVLATGSIAEGKRGWLATIEWAGGPTKINVFHEAHKLAPDPGEDATQWLVDPQRTFHPNYIAGHTDASGKHWAFIGASFNPLMVDLDTLKVQRYSASAAAESEFPRSDGPASAFLSRAGVFYAAGAMNDFHAYRLDPQTHLFSPVLKRTAREWHSTGAHGGAVVENDGWLYYAGERRWLRYNLKTGQEEVLVTSPRSLPDYGAGGGWNLAVSQAFGLVAWYQGQIYQVSVLPAAGAVGTVPTERSTP